MQAARGAQVRLERDVAALRVIEALRMYAAEHDGQTAENARRNHGGARAAQSGDRQTVRIPTRRHKRPCWNLPPSDGLHSGNRRYEIQIAARSKTQFMVSRRGAERRDQNSPCASAPLREIIQSRIQ